MTELKNHISNYYLFCSNYLLVCYDNMVHQSSGYTQSRIEFYHILFVVAGMDYSGLPGTLSFTPTTDRTQCLTIQIEDDVFAEETETILLLLSGSVDGALIQAQATVLILDNDGMLEIYIE